MKSYLIKHFMLARSYWLNNCASFQGPCWIKMFYTCLFVNSSPVQQVLLKKKKRRFV